ncbi:glutamic acid-rich protein [Folsomia candida]|uniref:RalA-binding protein 1 n=1 Tax=Folsomia candida TaxID=158441 RepID=A0A226EEN6_FOLCA|nr:glutamic acid-rich protein [Folsomia candida]OXA56025.1 RalA-binding protein 1 [Folsomia candida]
MEFDSPEVQKEFPGLYAKPDCEMGDPADYDEDLDKKKKKDKKDSKKDKGYATLADENSQEEDDGGGSGEHSAKKKLKGFKLPSAKKKEKEKDKEPKDKDVKKDKKVEKDKKKGSDTERKSIDREVPFSTVRIPFSAERHRDIHAHRSSVPAAFFTSTPKTGKDKSETADNSPVPHVEKERSSSSALNAFLNAPAPLFLQKKKAKDKKEKEPKKEKEKVHKKDKEEKIKDKEHKDKKEYASGVAKVKLKLMRSKNSLDDPHEKGELHVSVSHQFPEDPDSLGKEIRKYEQLLEQTHTQMKSSKKVSKKQEAKQEEQLWELQRTLTALKRKLRSINALSTASINHHPSAGPPNCSVSDIGSESTVESANSKSSPISNNTIPPISGSPNNAVAPANSNSTIPNHLEKACDKLPQQPPEIIATVTRNESPPKLKSPTTSESCAIIRKDITSVLEDSTSINTITTTDRPRKLTDDDDEPVEDIVVVIPPPASQVRKSARRSLDFSEIVVDNKKHPTSISNCCSKDICVVEEEQERKAMVVDPEVKPIEESPTVIVQHEQVQVHVIVHQESKEDDDDDVINDGDADDDSSVAKSEEDDDEALPSRIEENIVSVLDDANAMLLGSMHEELEEAALVFGQKLSKGRIRKATVSKSEPTFGEQNNDSSDVELIRDEDDEGPESYIEDLIPELMCLPEFETAEYISYENDQLALFNKAVQEEIMREESDLEVMIEELESIRITNDTNKTENNFEDCDMEKCVAVWKAVKAENEALHMNVSRLRQMVALNKLEEFKLETRLRYLEDKIIPLSPITITTPLHSEAM